VKNVSFGFRDLRVHGNGKTIPALIVSKHEYDIRLACADR
jgi:hypothetical protein